MASPLYLLPPVTAAAAENMATDWLMLTAFAEPSAARLRFYRWARPSFTFGYGQKYAEARTLAGPQADLIRRPTGGGLVDHREDWTYSLVLPATHPLARARACESYKQVHEALSAALMLAGVDCRLQPADCKPAAAPMTAACFAKAETFDVVRSDNGRKIAGAAQKRTQQGLLFQGTAARRETKEVQDWTQLENNFARLLADLLKLQLGVAPQRPGSEKALAEVAAQFAATEWNQKR